MGQRINQFLLRLQLLLQLLILALQQKKLIARDRRILNVTPPAIRKNEKNGDTTAEGSSHFWHSYHALLSATSMPVEIISSGFPAARSPSDS
jgi:hypothetical protein